jgi:Uma2 family endonuclease
MAREYAVIPEENWPIPPEAFTFEGFQRWVESDGFPETGRIDFLAGQVEAEMSPEDLHTHGIVKAAIAGGLQALIADRDLGEIYVDRTRVRSSSARLSVEPDVVVVLWDSLESGRVRYVPARRKGPDRFSAIEGAPDLIVEILSDRSEVKDGRRLPRLYAQAGVPEFWLADARGREMDFNVLTLSEGAYRSVQPDSEGWLRSPVLGLDVRLTRSKTRLSTWRYRLEHQLR